MLLSKTFNIWLKLVTSMEFSYLNGKKLFVFFIFVFKHGMVKFGSGNRFCDLSKKKEQDMRKYTFNLYVNYNIWWRIQKRILWIDIQSHKFEGTK